MRKIKLMIVFAIVLSTNMFSKNIFVSKQGKDVNTGKKNKPLLTIQKAQQLAKSYKGKEKVNVYINDGVYYLPQTLVFDSDDSGTETKPIVYKAINEGKVVISGGSLLDVEWTEYKNGIYKAKVGGNLNIDQLFVNGVNQRMARYPNYDPNKKAQPYNGFAADAISKEKADKWSDPKGGYIHAIHGLSWGGFHYLIKGKKANGELDYEGGWQNNRPMYMHKKFRMVENIFEELDAPGEWYHNKKEGIIYFYPEKSTDLKIAKVEIVRLKHLIEFNGTEQAPVEYITFDGIVFKHTARTFMITKERMLRSDWTIYRGGAIRLTGTKNISILNSEFDQMGGNAVFVNNYNRNTLIKGCHIHDAGASGVCFVGDVNAVYNPLYGFHEKNDYSKISLIQGPKTNNYPSNCIVEDCLINNIGCVEKQPAGVQIEMSQYITVRDVSIYDCPRAGINIGDGAWGGHLIERCDVFNTVLETADHGSFNSWGRDRYWRFGHINSPVLEDAVNANPQLPYLDAMATTIIRNSRWRCDHGWDVDLDDGATNYEVYNNLFLGRGLKLKEGYKRKAWNNIMANNGGFYPLVWFDNSLDEFYSNIISGQHRLRNAGEFSGGKLVDRNLFYGPNTKAKDAYLEHGWDKNSIHGDPMFENPSEGDFSVKDGSPAFKVGFKNFPMDQFGVKKPSLKAIARVPAFGKKGHHGITHNKPSVKSSNQTPYSWSGTELRELKEGEFSVYGVSEEGGGLVVSSIDANSPLYNAGLRKNDMILKINQFEIQDKVRLDNILKKNKKSKMNLSIVRSQQNMKLVYHVK